MRLSKKSTDTLFLLVPEWVNRMKGLLFLPIIIQFIGLDSYGAYVQIMANVAIFASLSHLAIGQSLVRFASGYRADEREALRTTFWSCLLFVAALSLALSGLYAALTPLIDRHLLDGTAQAALYASAPLVVTEALFFVLLPYINSRARFKEASIVRLARGLLPYLGLVAGFVVYGHLAAGLIAAATVRALVIAVLLARVTREVGLPRFDGAVIIRYVRFSWPLALSRVSQTSLEAIPRYVVPWLLGPAALGLFNIMQMLARLLSAFIEPIMKYLNTRLPAVWDAGEYPRARRIMERCVRYYCAVVCLGSAILMATFADVMARFLPSIELDAWQNLDAALAALCLFALVLGFSVAARIWAKMRERPGVVLVASVLGLLSNALLGYGMTAVFGLAGASIGLVCGFFVVYVVTAEMGGFVQSRRTAVTLALLMIPTVAAYLAATALSSPTVTGLSLAVAGAFAVFVPLTHVVRAVSAGEIIELVLGPDGLSPALGARARVVGVDTEGER